MDCTHVYCECKRCCQGTRGVGLEGFHSGPIPDIQLICFALYILLKGRHALHIAAINNNVEAAKLFLLNGADVNANDCAVSISVC
jgi:hypothetical protein